MGAREEIARLLKEASASMKRDVKGALASLERAYAIAREAGDAHAPSVVAEELARGWGRRKSNAKSLHYARKATKLAPEQKATWTTLAKTCELVASRMPQAKSGRARALYRSAASGFKKAASLTKDPEDKRWLQELAGDAARQAKPKES